LRTAIFSAIAACIDRDYKLFIRYLDKLFIAQRYWIKTMTGTKIFYKHKTVHSISEKFDYFIIQIAHILYLLHNHGKKSN